MYGSLTNVELLHMDPPPPPLPPININIDRTKPIKKGPNSFQLTMSDCLKFLRWLWFTIQWIYSCRHALPHHVDAVLLHVLADLVGHLLIEAA